MLCKYKIPWIQSLLLYTLCVANQIVQAVLFSFLADIGQLDSSALCNYAG